MNETTKTDDDKGGSKQEAAWGESPPQPSERERGAGFMMKVETTHHGGTEQDKDGRSHQCRGPQEAGGVAQAHEHYQGPPCKEAARRGSLIEPVPVAGTDVHQLRTRGSMKMVLQKYS